jgi:epoxyqueuosine reductase
MVKFVTAMPNKDIHKKGFVPEPPQGSDLSRDRILLHCCCAPCSTAIIEWMVGEGLRPGIFFSNSNIVPFDEYALRREELRRYAAAHGLETFDDEYDHAAWLAYVRRLEGPDYDKARAGEDDRSCDALHPSAGSAADPAGLLASSAVPPVRVADMPERGPRCLECFRFRLLRAADFAATQGYRLLTTTLASSRWKDLGQVDEAGRWACAQVNGIVSAEVAGCVCGQADGCDSADAVGDESGQVSGGLSAGVSGVRSEVLWWGQNWRRGGLQERRNALIKEWEMYNQTFCGCEFSSR